METTHGHHFTRFTPIAWASSGGYKADSSRMSFLFRLKNQRGSEDRISMLTQPSNGPAFGCHGILVSGNCASNSNSVASVAQSHANAMGLNPLAVCVYDSRFTVAISTSPLLG
jgi:hypothetical protein